jgi:sec-independent protein translocase protein TatA
MQTLGLFGNFNGWELVIILAIALLLFGRRLPDVGKSLGKGIVEFKKGLKGIEDDIEDQSSKPAPRRDLPAEPENPYRAPLSETGEDRRVSRADSPDVATEPKTGQSHS